MAAHRTILPPLVLACAIGCAADPDGDTEASSSASTSATTVAGESSGTTGASMSETSVTASTASATSAADSATTTSDDVTTEGATTDVGPPGSAECFRTCKLPEDCCFDGLPRKCTPTSDQCIDGICVPVPDPPCTPGDPCPPDGTRICVVVDGEPVCAQPCESDRECVAPLSCSKPADDGRTLLCFAHCAMNEGCSGELTCDEASGYCYCGSDAACPDGEVCRDAAPGSR